MSFISELKDFLIFDGGMGTMLQARGLVGGEIPESYNITHPEIVLDIHKEYVAAGSHVITTNTFQANRVKLKDSPYTVEQVVTAAVKIAKQSGSKYVALDLGPTGQLLEPMGTLSFDEAYELYKEQVIAGASAGADLIIIETIGDFYEAKAAVLAAKENSDLPVICSFTYQGDGRTFVGNSPETNVLTIQAMGVDAIGINCSFGPKELLPIAKKYLEYAKVPVLVQPNAGLPQEKNGCTEFDVNAEEFSVIMKEMAELGVKILGGCCGTNPEYIKGICKAISGIQVTHTTPKLVTMASSATSFVFFNGVTIVGEKINPTGKKKLKEALRTQDFDYINKEAIDQVKARADIIGVNAGLPEIDEPEILKKMVKEVSSVVTAPLQIDSADPQALEAAARIYNGRPVINSVNGTQKTMDEVFPIVKRYGCMVIGLTLDEKGLPENAAARLEIARKIVNSAASYGIAREDIIIDCLVLTASSHQNQMMETLNAVRLVKQELGVKTVLGVSNVSFGMPNRELLNTAFLTSALSAGLDVPIINPMSQSIMNAIDSFKVINCQDLGCKSYVSLFSGTQASAEVSKTERSLQDMIIEGLKEEVTKATLELLKTESPIDIIDKYFIPSLDIVGRKYESGEIFLPQLIHSADTVKEAFEILKGYIHSDGQTISKGKIALATVKGDVHDIGKNIVKVLLENYGYEIFDLGKDVEIDDVVKCVKENDIKLVGLSALMTITVKSMKRTIEALRENNLDCKVMVGGAVLNEEYAKMVGADFYAKDAREGIRVAGLIFE